MEVIQKRWPLVRKTVKFYLSEYCQNSEGKGMRNDVMINTYGDTE